MAIGALLAACIPRTPPVRLPAPASAAVAMVRDHVHDPGVSDVPRAVGSAIADALAARNLQPEILPFDQARYERVRDTRDRTAAVAKAATGAEWLLLVEARAEYFDLIDGLYRWTVKVKLTAVRRDGTGEPSSVSLDVPVFLNFDHEREDEALLAASRTIAERSGLLFDSVLRSVPGAAPASTRALKADGAVYFVLVDRFANGDPRNDGSIDRADPAAFHGGDLQGVIDHLDDIQSLGVTTVWLSPVFRMRTEKFHGYGAFHGYWIEDPTAIEPRFGSVALLRKLSDELHRRGMRLLLDVVLNHVAFDSPLLQQHPDWFHHAGPLTDWKDPEQLVTHDVEGLPDLAQEREDVYRYLTDASLRWIRDVRPDGFRLDAVKHVSVSFWNRYAREIHATAGPAFELIGEYLDGDPSPIARVEREGGFDAMFDFPFGFATLDVFCKDQPPARLASVLSSDRLYADPASLVTLLDDHDLPRLATQCGGDLSREEQALTFLLTTRGVPMLTYGTEVGLTGAKEPENRGDMRFDPEHPLRTWMARELALRRTHPALSRGAPRVVDVRDDFLAYARIAPEEAALIAVNRSRTSVDLGWPRALSSAHETVAPRSISVAFATPAQPAGFRAEADSARAQWETGSRKRPVEFELIGGPPTGSLYVVGSGPELGSWNPSAGLGPATAGIARCVLPTGGVFEYKLVTRTPTGAVDWEKGENRWVFVAEGETPLRLKVTWRGNG